MEYTLHSVRKLMTFFHLFKDIITHKLYSRTFSDFFTGSAKYNELNWAPLVWRLNFFTKKKNVKIVHCAFPWQNCVKFPSFYTLSKRMRVALYFLSSLSPPSCSTIRKTWHEIQETPLKLYTHTPDPIGKPFWTFLVPNLVV